jgi:GAF domain-containing protein/HAMP domain-containing protein
MTDQTSHTTVEAHQLGRNAWRTSWIVGAASALYAVFLWVQATQTGAPQVFRAALLMSGLTACAAVSVWLSRHGRSTGGILLLIGWFFIVLLESTTRWAGLGFLLGLTAVLGTSLVALLCLPRVWATRMIGASFLVGAIIIFLDLFGSADRDAANFFGAPLVAMLGMLVTAGAVITRRFSTYSLRTKLVVSFLLVNVLSVAIVAVIAIGLSQEALTRSANQSLLTAASKTAAAVDSFLAAEMDTLRTEALLPDFSDLLSLPAAQQSGAAASEVDEILHNLALREPLYIQAYTLLDSSGRIVSSSSPERVGQQQLWQVMATGLPQVSEVEFDPDSGAPSFYIGAPVRNENRAVIGVLTVRFDATILQELIRSTNGLAGQDSFATLLDDYGLRLGTGEDIAALYKTIVPLQTDDQDNLRMARRLPSLPLEQLSTNYPEFQAGLNSYQPDAPYFSAEVHDPRTAQIKALETARHTEQVAVAALNNKPAWRVAFAQPQAIFLQPAQAQTRVITIAAFLVASLVALGALGLAQMIARPIVHLTGVANRVSAGDLNAQAPVQSRDEIGALALAFNSMTAQLRDLVGSLEDRIQARTEQLRASADVGRTATSILGPEQLLSQVAELITKRFGFYYTGVFTLDEPSHQAVLRAATGEAGQVLLEHGHRLPVDDKSMVGAAIITRSPRIALDVGEGAIRFANPLLPNTRSEIALPLRVGDRVLGALDVQSEQANAFDEGNTEVLQTMADQIAVALSNAEAFQRSERQATVMARLNELSRTLVTATSLEDVALITVPIMARLLGESRIAIAQTTANPHILSLREFRANTQQPVGDSTPIPTATSLLGECVARGATIYLADLSTATEQYSDVAGFYRQGVRAGITLPLRVGERVLGAFTVGADRTHAYAAEQINQLEQIAAQLAVTIENLNLAEQTQQTLAELNAANRQLVGQAWEQYTHTAGLQAAEWRNGDWLVLDPRVAVRETSQALIPAAAPLTLPIRVRGTTIGEFHITTADAYTAWDEDDTTFAQSLVDQVGQVLETARLLDETERTALREKAVANAADKIHRSTEIESVLQSAVTELQRITRRRGISVQLGFGQTTPPGRRTPNGDTGGER